MEMERGKIFVEAFRTSKTINELEDRMKQTTSTEVATDEAGQTVTDDIRT
jgi:hypothetical protein